MSVRAYSGAFVGLRVQRSIDKIPHTKHFSFRIPTHEDGVTQWRDATEEEKAAMLKQAEEYDKELAQMQKAAKEKVHANEVFDPFVSRTNTGIRGIAYRISPDSRGYPVEAFWLNLTHDGKPHSSNVRLANRSWKDGWKLIVGKLVELKSLDDKTAKKLLRSIPDEKKLKAETKPEPKKTKKEKK